MGAQLEPHFAEWTLVECLAAARTIPDDGIQCIRVECDLLWSGEPVEGWSRNPKQ
jgi:hypothetical protein